MAKLRFPIEFEGKRIEEITLRRAKVKDLRSAGKVTDDNGEAEMICIANLADLPVEAISELDIWDYRILQDEFKAFFPKLK